MSVARDKVIAVFYLYKFVLLLFGYRWLCCVDVPKTVLYTVVCGGGLGGRYGRP